MTASADTQPSQLEYFPISWFATVMGLAGGAIAWNKAALVFGISDVPGSALSVVAATTFVILSGLYLAKAIRFPHRVTEEFRHPVRLSFFPAISISLILLSVTTLDSQPALSRALWWTGASLHLALTLYVVSAWVHHETFQIQHTNPTWFIPVVGNVLVPIAGVHHAPIEISWFFFSIGLVFWIALFTIILNRMIFHGILPTRLMPTLFILIAPPAVAFIAYLRLTHEIDAFARIMYYAALFIALLLTVQVKVFLRCEFYLSWWACSFPIAALTVATLIMHEITRFSFFGTLAWVLLAVLSLILVGLVAKTAQAVRQRTICVPEA